MRLPRPSLRSTRAQARALSAYWDEVARRAPADPVPPPELDRDLATTARRLAALPVDAVPDPRFAAQLLDRLAAPSQERTAMPTAAPTSPGRIATRPINPHPHAAIRPLDVAGHAPRRWSAVAFAVALVVAALWVTSLRDGDPQGRRDTTAVAAVGSPAATLAPSGDAATPHRTTLGQPSPFTPYLGIVDLSGPSVTADAWLIDLVPGAFLAPASGDPYFVMPLSGMLGDRLSETVLHAGQSVSLPNEPSWQLENTTQAPIRVLVLAVGGRNPQVVTGEIPNVFRAAYLGPLTFDPAFAAAVVQVTTIMGQVGDAYIDTGASGIAIVVGDRPLTTVDVLAGDGLLRRELQDPEAGVPIVPGDTGVTSAYLNARDVLSITGGAAFTVRDEADELAPVVVVTIQFESALLNGVNSAPLAAAASPVGAAGCDVEPYAEQELRAIVATPAPGPLPSIGLGLADGQPADAATVAEVDAAAGRLAACVRTNDPLRWARLWSDDGLRFLYSIADLEEDLAQDVLSDDSLRTVRATVQDVRVHPDGHVSAVVDLDGEIAYVVWVKQDGVYLVELFNDAIFAGPLADGARCDAPPLDPAELAAIVPATLTPTSGLGLDISAPLPEGQAPPAVSPGEPGVDIATAAVARLFDCLSTRDPARVHAMATEAFRAQWAGVAAGLVPLAEPLPNPDIRLSIAVSTVYSVDVDDSSGARRIGVVISGSIAAYVVFTEVDGEWLIDGWAPL